MSIPAAVALPFEPSGQSGQQQHTHWEWPGLGARIVFLTSAGA